jgi:diacylglycerol kinase family enzyme
LKVGEREHRGPALAVIIANGQYFAGGWNVAPRASLNDGALDVQIVAASKWEAPRLVPKMIKGLHLSDRTMRRMSGGHFELECDSPWPVECDGEALGNTPVHGAVLPGAIDLKI